MKDIFSATNATDEDYIFIRDDKNSVELRELLNSLWSKFFPLADSNFVDEISNDFHPRFWEMYLANVLLNNGMKLSSKDFGPDICVDSGDKSVWVEAIAPTKGNGADAVPVQEKNGQASNVPEDKIILRLRSAIEEKHRKYLKYISNNTMSKSDPYVIAINGYQLPSWMCQTAPSFIEKAVYPLGCHTVTFNKKTKNIVDRGIEYRPEIIKQNNATVDTTVFQNPDYAGISAIIFSCANVWGLKSSQLWESDSPGLVGKDFQVLHNSLANNPIKHGWLKVGREYWESENQLHTKEW